MTTMTKRTGLIALGACLLAGAFGAGYRMIVLAQGAPNDQPLFYSGVLDVNGTPASGDYTVKLALYDAATAGHSLCGVEVETKVDDGHFRIDASDCANAVADEPNAWVAISFVDPDGEEHKLPKRSKIGAVPYALEAQHAVSASEPAGALAKTIDELTDRVTELENGSAHSSAFIAVKTDAQTIGPSTATVVKFNDEQVDVGDEYDPGEGIFTAAAPGLYEFSCTIAFDVNAGNPGTWEVALVLDGYEHTFVGSYTEGEAVTRSITSVIELKKDDYVACTGLTSLASADMNISHDAYNVFTGHRIK